MSITFGSIDNPELELAEITGIHIAGHRIEEEMGNYVKDRDYSSLEARDFAAIIDSLNLMAKIDNHFASPLMDEALIECGLGDNIENSEFVSAPNTNLLGGKSAQTEIT